MPYRGKQRVGRKVRDSQKSRVVKATVIDVVGPRMSVRLATNGVKLHGIRYIGGPVSAGAEVEINYSSGQPIAMCQGEEYVPPDADERPVPDYKPSVPEYPDIEHDTGSYVSGQNFFFSDDVDSAPDYRYKAKAAVTGSEAEHDHIAIYSELELLESFVCGYNAVASTASSGIFQVDLTVTFDKAGGTTIPAVCQIYAQIGALDDDSTFTPLSDALPLIQSSSLTTYTCSEIGETYLHEFASTERLECRIYRYHPTYPWGSPYEAVDVTLHVEGETGSKLVIPTTSSGTGVTQFIQLTDTPSSYQASKLVSSTSGGDALEFIDPDTVGPDEFTDLIDTPNTYTANKWLKVNSAGSGLELTDAPSTTGSGGLGDPYWYFPGVLNSSGSPVGLSWVAPRSGTIGSVFLHLRDQGTSGSTIVDIHLNGTTIFTTQANRPFLLYNDPDGIVESVTPDVTSISSGDLVEIYIDQAAPGSADLTVLMDMGGYTVGGGGASDFTDLDDTPSTYSGKAGKSAVVNDAEDGLEFSSPVFDIWLYGG